MRGSPSASSYVGRRPRGLEPSEAAVRRPVDNGSPGPSGCVGRAPYAGSVLPVVTYFLARLVLFALAAVALGLLGAGPLVAVVGGLLISVMLSYLLLGRLRGPATAAVAARMEARQQRRAAHPDEDEIFEDAVVDDALRDGDQRR